MRCDVFISYSRVDVATAERLERTLTDAGLIVWRDKNEILPGDSFSDDIAAAIDSCFAVVWLASTSSVQATWVRRELAFATDAKKVLVPVLINGMTLIDIPPGIRLLFPHIDFASLDSENWHQQTSEIVRSLREIQLKNRQQQNRHPLSTDDPVSMIPISSLAANDWPDQIGAIETPTGLDLLPIEEGSPLLMGVAIDVSGSMQTAIQNEEGDQRNRLAVVLDAVRDLSRRYRSVGESPEVVASATLAKLFAYGFGFADRALKYGKLGALAQRFIKDSPPIPARVFRGAVRDLFEVAGIESHTLTLKEIDSQWQTIESRLWDQRMDLFGATQMRAALEMIAERFNSEFASYPSLPHSVLFLISDGKSKDGSPLEACRSIAGRGTIILSCYLTDQDVTEPRRLYSRPQPGWPEGADTLFRCSSAIEEDSILLPVLREKGWLAEEGDRLFVQMNQSILVSEFVSFALDLVTETIR